jgi:sugar-specific transcriptional regulator TrmB
VVYKGLEELLKMGFIEKMETKKITRFRAEHPSKLQKLLEEREKEVQLEKQNFLANLPDLVSTFNLSNGKPGVKFYEGFEGIKKVMQDTLTSKTIIYTYADIEVINKHVKALNDEYAIKRDKLGLAKKILIVDSPYSREFMNDFHKQTTDTKFIEINHFGSAIQIYDNKIAYTTISDERKICIIIEDESIYLMQKALFELNWENGKSYEELIASKAQ